MSDLTDRLAQSNVDMIEHCLDTPDDEHRWECAEEQWEAELGERPALYVAVAEQDALLPFIMAIQSWDYWRSVRAGIDGRTG